MISNDCTEKMDGTHHIMHYAEENKNKDFYFKEWL